jgi:outer membrane murein-binding lipoprotein Lpp
MGGSSRRIRLCAGVAFSAFILIAGLSGAARADSTDAAQIKALQAQIDQLQRTVKDLAAKQTKTEDVAQAAKKQAGNYPQRRMMM